MTIENGHYTTTNAANGTAIQNKVEDSVITINDCTVNAAFFAFYNMGTATINNGTFISTSCNHNKDNTGASAFAYCFVSAGDLTFNNGSVTGVQGGLAINSGKAVVKNGTFKTVACTTGQATSCTNGGTAHYAIYCAGERGQVKATVSGGTFTSASKVAVFVGNDNDGGQKLPAALTITGGTFNSGAQDKAVFQAPKTGNLEVYSGNFSGSVTDFIVKSSAETLQGDRYIVAPLTIENSVAEVGGKYYATLPDAIAAAKTGDTVKLVKDITSSSTIQISQKTDIKLDLNGKKLTVTSGDALLNNGALTILDSLSGGKIISEKSGTIGVGSNSTTTIQSGEFESVEGAVFTGLSTGATITIEGGTFSASDNAVIAGNGSNRTGDPNVINIKGGTFNGSIKTAGYVACGIYAPWKDQITVSGGTFNITGGAGIVAVEELSPSPAASLRRPEMSPARSEIAEL